MSLKEKIGKLITVASVIREGANPMATGMGAAFRIRELELDLAAAKSQADALRRDMGRLAGQPGIIETEEGRTAQVAISKVRKPMAYG